MQWVTGNRYLNRVEQENNVTILTPKFLEWGWTLESIAAMLGNMEKESTINPGIWENLDDIAKGGYGLVQWTPYTKYSEWAGNGWEGNGDKECERIKWELDNGVQWISTSEYPLSFLQFTQGSDVEYLAWTWLYNYERPTDLNQPSRAVAAQAWYQFIKDMSVKKKIIYWYFACVNNQRRFNLW